MATLDVAIERGRFLSLVARSHEFFFFKATDSHLRCCTHKHILILKQLSQYTSSTESQRVSRLCLCRLESASIFPSQ